ncbi:uncharacterized protein F5Z01DRAFT_665870 [Emericellopsis atlantica]|uniref:C2H2-type domain-containing protein n=1 Tax=Emericellopsis atlantica TaxID=2614577 RepID=A0A9P7ZFE4_9HYPO|nr:uncharacterized protein F5Z01DRAFT_665870 [Emericellopsis atlantica]KAG9250550.1 hypothetical protein F5Z01DRAFT_665870 [Emericellopsis atlantica]
MQHDTQTIRARRPPHLNLHQRTNIMQMPHFAPFDVTTSQQTASYPEPLSATSHGSFMTGTPREYSSPTDRSAVDENEAETIRPIRRKENSVDRSLETLTNAFDSYQELKVETGISSEEVHSYIDGPSTSTGLWTCTFQNCGKEFSRKENVKSHVQTHLNDRQFQCEECKKCFVRAHDLKRHARIHLTDKPYICPCQKAFARQDALTRHRQRGMCEGALDGVVRKSAKRGRPRKNPEIDGDRRERKARTRRQNNMSISSVSTVSTVSTYTDSSAAASPEQMLDFHSMVNLQHLSHDVQQMTIPEFDNSATSSAPMPTGRPFSQQVSTPVRSRSMVKRESVDFTSFSSPQPYLQPASSTPSQQTLMSDPLPQPCVSPAVLMGVTPTSMDSHPGVLTSPSDVSSGQHSQGPETPFLSLDMDLSQPEGFGDLPELTASSSFGSLDDINDQLYSFDDFQAQMTAETFFGSNGDAHANLYIEQWRLDQALGGFQDGGMSNAMWSDK